MMTIEELFEDYGLQVKCGSPGLRRSCFETCLESLSILSGGEELRVSTIMRRSNTAWKRMMIILNGLELQGFIEKLQRKRSILFRITPSGFAHVQAYIKLRNNFAPIVEGLIQGGRRS